MGSKVDLGPSQDTTWDNHGVSTASKGLAPLHFGAQTAILAAILDSQTSSNGDQNLKNVTSQNNMTFTLIFSWFRHDLGVRFLCVFHMEILLKSRKLSCKKAYETLAMATKSKVGVFEMFVKIKKILENPNFWGTSI